LTGLTKPVITTVMDFAQYLRAAIQEEGVTIYALARTLDPANPDRAERNLYRWLSGQTNPSIISRRALALALGRPPDFFNRIDWDFERAMDLRVEAYFRRAGITVVA
jgi:transcriptional regulator with XRE-family HTH domain